MRCSRWFVVIVWNILLTCGVFSNIKAGKFAEQPSYWKQKTFQVVGRLMRLHYLSFLYVKVSVVSRKKKF